MTNLYTYNDTAALACLNLSKEDLWHKVLKNKETDIEAFAQALKENEFPAFTIANHEDDLPTLQKHVQNWQKNFKHVVFLGVGGSSLGAQTLVHFMGVFTKHQPQIHFLDNVDPFTFEQLIQSLELEKTMVVAVSKSGGTIETMAQTFLFAELFEHKGLPLSQHFLGVTETHENPLRTFLTKHQIPIVNHPENVGGRFTVLTLVGLLPAMLAGMDVAQLRQGALQVLEAFLQNPAQSTPARAAALSVMAGEKGKPIQYLMPYSDRLQKLSDWYVQLWAESLGKEGKGTTPVPALGSTDQHSALQMLMDGAKDKMVTLITPDCAGEGQKINPQYAQLVGNNVYDNLNLGKLIYSQAQGTAEALSAASVPVRVFQTPALNEAVLGALLMHFMLETAVAGILWGVNTWDQPGVEDGKKRTLLFLKKF